MEYLFVTAYVSLLTTHSFSSIHHTYTGTVAPGVVDVAPGTFTLSGSVYGDMNTVPLCTLPGTLTYMSSHMSTGT